MKRRDFLKGAGVMAGTMVVGFSAWDVAELAGQAPGCNGTGSNALDAWLSIAADGSVTVYTGKCELGTGLYTAQVQLIAEELSVPLNRVKLIQCDTALTPDQGTLPALNRIRLTLIRRISRKPARLHAKL
jgi:CO/xanthine dehydrogenase Mo-binding subunit